MITRNTIVIAVAAALAATVSLVVTAQDDGKPFALVYQSDTRGYYRPCG